MRLPWTSEARGDVTLFELIQWYWESIFEKDPKMMLEAGRLPSGEIVIDDTGDPVLERWEKQVAAGETPDLYEGLSEAERAGMDEEMRFRQRAREARASLLGDDIAQGHVGVVEAGEPTQGAPVPGWAEAVSASRGSDG